MPREHASSRLPTSGKTFFRKGLEVSRESDIVEHMFDTECATETELQRTLDEDETGIPGGLDRMEPGIMLAAVLSQVDVSELSGYDRIVVLRAQQRMVSHYQATVYTSMAGVSDHMAAIGEDPDGADEAAAAEIRAALRLTRRGGR